MKCQKRETNKNIPARKMIFTVFFKKENMTRRLEGQNQKRDSQLDLHEYRFDTLTPAQT